MLLDRPYTRGRTHHGSFDLVTLPTTLKVRVARNHSVQPSGHDIVLPCHGSVLLSFLFGWLNQDCVYALLLWGLLLVSTSRYSVEVHRMLNLFALTCKSVSQSCLRIHLDCLTAVKSNLFGHQDCLNKCRRDHQGELVHLLGFHQLRQCDCLGEPAVSIVSSCGSILAPRKDDGTDFGCAWIQSNGLIALETKYYCRGLVNSCSTSEPMQYRAYFWELVRVS